MKDTFLPSVAALGHIIDPLAGQSECRSMNERAKEFARAWLRLLGDRAHVLRCDPRLIDCAQQHAEYLAARTPEQLKMSMHRGRNGSYPNERVVAQGYRLPPKWELDRNNVESCSHNDDDPAAVAISLSKHEHHHEHMYGIGMFANSTVYGVGNKGNYYVLLICPVESK